MKRKLVKQGDNALTVTIPASWVHTHGLTPGNQVDLREEGQELILSSLPAQEKTGDITVAEGAEEKIRELYREGYDRIVAHFSNAKTLSKIQSVVGKLYGFETIEITTATCTIKSVYEEKPEELPSHIKRMATALKVLQELVLKQFKNRKENEHIPHFRDNVVKQADLIVRLIRKHRLIEELSMYEEAMKGEQMAKMDYEVYKEGLVKSMPTNVIAFFEKVKKVMKN